MICFPNAKVNLGLNIVSKRPDAYHNIETVFYPVNINDALEVVPASKKEGIFKLSGIPVDGDIDNNLAIRAYRLMQQHYSIPEIDIYLQKNIPSGAGLGGGSADAAFMLQLLNEYADLKLDDEQLEALAANLGADCPFFIRNKAVYAEGIGNIFTPIDLNLTGYQLILIKPDIHISTGDAYAGIRPQKAQKSLLEVIKLPMSQWKDWMINDFEATLFKQYPEIGKIKESLYQSGAIYASMSGSGSAVYGIFDENVTEIKLPYPYLWIDLN